MRKIGSLGRVVTGKTPSTADPENFGGPYPFITIPDLGGRVFIDRAARTLSKQGAETMLSCLLPPGAVMMSCIATVGKCGITTKPSFTNQQINSVICDPQVDPRYLFYCFTQLAHTLDAVGGGGSVYTNVSKSRFSDIDIPFPRLKEQKAIAHVLGTLDDKIELNRRMNETLEQMAQAIFKSWFVDFLPVRAKMAAKAKEPLLALPKGEPGRWYVYALECENGSLYIGQTENLRERWQQHLSGKGGKWTKGHPPKRLSWWESLPSREAAVKREKWLKTGYGRKWLKKEIAAIARTQTGDPVRMKANGRENGIPSSLADPFPNDLVDSEIGQIPSGWGVGSLKELATIKGGKQLPSAKRGPIGKFPVFGANGIMGYTQQNTHDGFVIAFGRVGAYCGSVHWSYKGAWINNNSSSVVPLRWTEYVLQVMLNIDFASMRTGSAQPFIPNTALASAQILVPSPSIAKVFCEIVRPLRLKQAEHIEESRSLAAIRDALLPKLLSGEVRIPDAEMFPRETGP